MVPRTENAIRPTLESGTFFASPVYVVLLCLACLTLRTQTRAQTAEPFVIIEEHGAPGRIDIQEIGECLQLMTKQLNLTGRALPPVVVYHVSSASAQYLGVNTTSIYRNTGGGNLRYEMWVIGKPSAHVYSYLLESVLRHHFHMTMDEEARARVINYVEKTLSFTIHSRSLR